MNYDGKTALVLGLGESGLAIALWLARSGARVRVADTRAEPARLPALRAAVADAEFVAGPFTANLLDGVDFVAVSPGLAPDRELAEIAPAAAARHVPLWGEIELFAQALSNLKAEQGYSPKVIAITGTNGKTTVTSLTGLLCRRAGLTTKVAGNISPAALDVLREVIDANELPQAWVLELSSFQLHTTYSLNPDAATVLNITQDHLDWHGSMAAYAADKARIFGADTVRVLNRDDSVVMGMTAPGAAITTFGTGEPDAPGSFGLVNERGVLWLANANPGEEPEKKKKKNEPAEPVEVVINRLMPADALHIRGLHNASNALAALALCRSVGLPLAPLLHGLREYQGEPHRVELITSIDNVEYYDDSKGTNVGATVAALEGLGKTFGETDRQILLIAGGDGKGQDFSPLAGPCARYVRAVLLIGRDGPAIGAALEPTGVPCFELPGLPEAVRRANGLAKSGDVVLLSPACASLDMFTNYAHRAQVFVDAVRDIALEKGQEI
ncbi:UDP-N-acetylmuramoyl-L-alanine--D-glutamate ligase [Telluria mixta]|uniref:UDP-N-acetylmuramoylalanine--D-glutamate ligase n=1 Tax=Telluria mixta TaxID=34071 RepID=A0ABT2BWZ3_9BURK|nr:UDP-N-acetylmuramoyl-L-alanine--D-glutamate ligase [Telluria mixta]MCS0629630.1 UDP-N-acetylmuramoyl-L-alanine--D-glutamate ligase [Telluria mixta]WEM96801.1 UDP-N-acetylmuramoyl-L-alanine--D-glutamate ligase [Telluria mixta]